MPAIVPIQPSRMRSQKPAPRATRALERHQLYHQHHDFHQHDEQLHFDQHHFVVDFHDVDLHVHVHHDFNDHGDGAAFLCRMGRV